MFSEKNCHTSNVCGRDTNKYNQINKIIYAEKKLLEFVSPMPESNRHL